jgi:hypothetical protein
MSESAALLHGLAVQMALHSRVASLAALLLPVATILVTWLLTDGRTD